MRRSVYFKNLIIGVFLFMSMSMFAQIQIGTGTTTSQGIPIEPYYGYSYSQQIYLASEVNASGDITTLDFYYAGGTNLGSSNDWTIYIGHTTKTAFSSTTDWVASTAMTQVFSGVITATTAAGWISIDITDFTYNGTDNLVIAVDENASGWNSGSDEFHCSAGGTGRSIQYNNDSNNPDPTAPPSGNLKSYYPNVILGGIKVACPAPSTPVVSSITTTAADLSWTENGFATTWEVEWGAKGFVQGAGTMVTSITSKPLSLSGLTVDTEYDWYVRANCGAGELSTWEGPFTFNTAISLPYTQNFDAATTPNLPGGWAFINTTGSTSSKVTTSTSYSVSSPNSIYIYPGSTTGDLMLISPAYAGTANNTRVKFSARTSSTTGHSLVIGTLTDPTDAATFTPIQTIAITTTHTQYMINLGTSTDKYIAFKHDLAFSYRNIYLDDITWEDVPSCIEPNTLNTSSATATSANLAWTEAGTATEWEIEYGEAGFTPTGVATVSSIIANPHNLTGLTANTSYDWYVRSICGGGDNSTWVGPNNFSTAITIPYTQNFDAVTTPDLPIGWTSINTTGSTSPSVKTYTSNFVSSPNAAGLYNSYFSSGELMLVSPKYASTVNNTRVKFSAKSSSAGTNVIVGTQSDPTDGSTFTAIQTITLTATQTQYIVDLGTGTDTYFAFKHGYGTSYRYIYIDDVTWEEMPSCLEPTTLSTSNLLPLSVDLVWVEAGTATTWEIEWGVTGFVQGAGTSVTGITVNPHALSGLTPETGYEWYVRADCGSGDYSPWSGPSAFTTGIACPKPTTLAITNLSSSSVDLGWTEAGTATSWDIEWGATGFVQGAGTTITGTATNPHSLSSLTESTTYDFYVRAACGGLDGNSTWTGPFTFTTSYGAHTLPLAEDFESGFTYFENKLGNTVDFADETTLFHGGTHSIKNTHSSTNTNYVQETGILDLSTTTNAQLDFWHIAKTEGGYDKCFVEISVDGGATFTTLPASAYIGSSSDYASKGYFHEDSYTAWGTGTETPDNTWWKKESFSLSAYNVANVTLRFKLTSDGSGNRNGWCIDDIAVFEPSCVQPITLSAANITTTSANLAWIESGTATTWEIEWGVKGFTQGSGTTVTGITANPYSLSGLTSNTEYDWYVRADCGSSTYSDWTGPSSFGTNIILPYTQNFDAVTTPNLPTGWSMINTTGSTSSKVTTSTSYNVSSPNSAYIYNYSVTGDLMLISPLYSGTANNTRVQFSARTSYSTSHSVVVGTLTDPTDAATFTPIQTILLTTTHTQYTVNLGTSTDNYIAFRHDMTTNYRNIYIDDITWEDVPSCLEPNTLVSSNVGTHSVDLAWTEAATATTWEIEYGVIGFTQGSVDGTIISGATTNPYTIASGLIPETGYDWYVRSDCGSSDYSSWTGPENFTTGIACPKPTTLGIYSLTSTTANLEWTEAGSATAWDIEWGAAGFTQGAGTLISGSTTNPHAISSLTAETSYDFYVRANCGGLDGQSSWTGPYNFYTGYCVPSPTSVDANGITRVQLGTIDNNVASDGNYYHDYTSLTTDVTAGVSQDIIVTYETGYSYNTFAWVDWNNDLDFDDANEAYYLGESAGTNPTTVTWSFLVPATASAGNHLFRLGAADSGLGSSTPSNPCYTGTYGEFEDYTVNVIIPACVVPSALTESNITAVAADLDWTTNGAETAWDIEWGVQGFTQSGAGSNLVTNTSTKPYSLSGLAENTIYEWYVRANCGGTGTSAWAGPKTFSTDYACPVVTAQVTNNVTTTTVDLSWTENGTATIWDIEWGPTGFTQGAGSTMISGTTTNPHSLSALSANTTYDWYVRADCDANGTSIWLGPNTFTTALTVHTLPIIEDFESGFSYFGNKSGNGTDFAIETTLFHGGAQSVGNAHGSSQTNILMETGIVDLSSTSNAVLEFWHIAKTEGGYDDCIVEISTDGGATYVAIPNSAYTGSSADYSTKGYFHEDSYTEWGTTAITPDNTWWKKETFSLSAYNVANVNIRFRLTPDASTNRAGWFIDDISISEPLCFAPNTLAESSITITSADLTWAEVGSATEWEVEWGATGFTQGTGTTVSSLVLESTSLSSLTPGTIYDWYVRANCNANGYSDWSSMGSFTTTSAKAVNPTPSDNETDVATTSTVMDWDDVTGATGYVISIGTTSGGTDLVNKAAAATSTYTYAGAWDGYTTYFWTVNTVYSGGTVIGDEWEFLTACGTYTPTYSIDFATAANDCWTEANGQLQTASTLTGTSNSWGVDGFANSGTTGARKINVYGSSLEAWFISPSLNLNANYQLEFDLALTNYNGTNATTLGTDDTVAVAISLDNGTTWSKSNLLQTWTASTAISNTGEHITIDLSAYNGNTVKIGFYAVANTGNIDNDLSIDNFIVQTPPTCPSPTFFSYSNVTINGADFQWTEIGSATAWEIEYGASGYTAGSGTIVSAGTNPITISSLSSSTSYDCYVRADCGGSDYSTWVGPVSFTTPTQLPNCATAPDPADGNTSVTPGTVSLKWTIPKADASHDAATTYKIYFGQTSGSLTYLTSTSNLTYDVTANGDLETYYWQVIPSNSAGDAIGCSEWSFTTEVITIESNATAPWFDDFSTHTAGVNTITNDWLTTPNTVADFAWTVSSTASTPSTYTGPTTDNTGDDHFIFTEANSGSSGDVAYLYTPTIEIDALVSPELTFSYHMYGSNMGDLHIDIFDGSAYTLDVTTSISGQQQTAAGDVWNDVLVDLSAYSGAVHFRIRGVRGNGSNSDIAIDDFDLHEAPTCPAPTTQAVANILSTQADVSWTETGTAPEWEIEFGTTGFTPGNGIIIQNVPSNPFTISGLDGQVTYDWYVRSNCGGDFSAWVGPNTFTTASYSTLVNGSITKCSPLYARTGSTASYFYDMYSFTVSATGSYDLTATWTGFDGYLYLYESSFDPTTPATNLVSSDDDFNGATQSQITAQTLSTGTTYILVGVPYFANNIGGAIQFNIEGPGTPNGGASTSYATGYTDYTHNPHMTDGVIRTASYECVDQNGWTHYYYDNATANTYNDDNVLLSIEKNGSTYGIIGDGTFGLSTKGAAGAVKVGDNSNYVTSDNGWYVFNRFWELTPTQQPASGVNVKYYYHDDDFTALSTALNDAGHTPPNTHDMMYTFKINNVTGVYSADPSLGHINVPLASGNGLDGCWIYENAAAASVSEWAYVALADNFHSMETVVTHFSGGGGGSGDTDGDGDGTPLPIELLSIDGSAYDEFNLIEWQTATEYNVSSFVIERSATGKGTFEKVGSIAASGNSLNLNAYKLKDVNPLSKAYYRLRSIDMDGRHQVSQMIYIQRETNTLEIVNLYPNPTRNNINLILVSPNETSAKMTVRDIVGRLVYSETIELNKGSQNLNINSSTFDSGSYFISIETDYKKISKVFIKQ